MHTQDMYIWQYTAPWVCVRLCARTRVCVCAVCCSILGRVVICCRVLQCVAVCVAVCCSVRCSVLQCVAACEPAPA